MSTPTSDDLYAVLGLASDATPAQITRAYRTRLRQHHPDTRDPTLSAAMAADALQRIITAYAVLGDRARRASYDRRRAATARSPRTAEPSSRSPMPAAERYHRPPIQVGPVWWRPR